MGCKEYQFTTAIYVRTYYLCPTLICYYNQYGVTLESDFFLKKKDGMPLAWMENLTAGVNLVDDLV
jgi:hypothetical protein